MNFVAFLTALRSYADGSNNTADPARYFELPNNSSGSLFNIILRGANIVNRSDAAVTVADLALNLERSEPNFHHLQKSGNSAISVACYGLDEYDATGFFVTGRLEPIKAGNMGELLFYKKERKVDWTATGSGKNSSSRTRSFRLESGSKVRRRSQKELVLNTAQDQKYRTDRFLEVEFGGGLNLLTGETDPASRSSSTASERWTGERVSSDLVKDGAESAQIEGLFEVEPDDVLREIFETSGYAPTILIRSN
jgi:hypothetical protein